MKSRRLTRREFARALRQGRGCAFLHVKEYGDKDKGIKEELLKACLKSLEYDGQLESGRSGWIVDILDRAGDIKYYAEPIKAALEAALSGTGNIPKGDLLHLIHLGSSLFLRGFGEFQSLILQFCTHPEMQDDPLLLAEKLIDIAAYSGFELAVELTASDKVVNWERHWLYEYACSFLADKPEIDQYLAEKAKENQAVATFYKSVIEEEKERKQTQIKTVPSEEFLTLSQIMRAIESEEKPRRYVRSYYRFAKQASIRDLQEIAALIETESDEIKLYYYLYIFTERELPLVSNKVINLLFGPNIELRRVAQNSLSLVTARSVRRIALALMNDSKQRNKVRGINLLKNNFQLDDLKLLQETLTRLKKVDLLHHAAMDALEIARGSEELSLANLLEWIHDATPCSRCRFRAIEILIEKNCAPDQMLYEGQWDTSSNTVDLTRAHIAKRTGGLK